MRTITGHFDLLGQARNGHEDLIDTGIPAEQVHLDRETFAVIVMKPAATEAEVREILDRHLPRELESHES